MRKTINNKNEVHIAFEILLEEIEEVVNNLNEGGARAFQNGDYEKVRQTIEVATRLTDFREKIKTLQKEWDQLFKTVAHPSTTRKRKRKSKLPRGLRTPEDEFRRPILEALMELGGSASVDEVLRLVEKKMKNVLTPSDYEHLSSGQIRWRNTAQWCRNSLVREGLMKENTPRGVWEISDKGKKWLLNSKVKNQ